jgi:glycosyltransferase involved in cell wall biosynthesis
MRIAVVHDWLITYAGSERVLQQILTLYPEASLFSLLDCLMPGERSLILNKEVSTSFIQNLPFSRKRYRSYLPLMPYAIEQFDFSEYDLVISSSHAVAKSARTNRGQLHICYCHTPIRYVWDLRDQYLKEAGLDRGIKGWLANRILDHIQRWDASTGDRPDYYIANSRFIAERIKRAYGRDSSVIYPPVDVENFPLRTTKKEDFYLAASRLVPYKKMDLITKAFSAMPEKKLVVIGDGPDLEKVKLHAGQNVHFLGYQPHDTLTDYMQRAKAFVFAAEEDFGIVPVEAQACGTPVIAFGRGGALETVIPLGIDSGRQGRENKPTGVFFYEQTTNALRGAVRLFERHQEVFSGQEIRNNAMRFSIDRFKREFKEFIDAKITEHKPG